MVTLEQSIFCGDGVDRFIFWYSSLKIHAMVMKLLWNGYKMVINSLFIHIILVSYRLGCYRLVTHGFTHYGLVKYMYVSVCEKYIKYLDEKYDTQIGGTKAGDVSMWYKRRVVAVKEVELIGYGHLVIVKKKCGMQRLHVIKEKK